MNVCNTCNHEFGPFEYYVRIGKDYICEQCFWELALKELGGKSVKNDYQGNIDEDFEIDFDSKPPVTYVNSTITDLEFNTIKLL